MNDLDPRRVTVAYPTASPQVDFAVDRLTRELRKRVETVRTTADMTSLSAESDLNVLVGVDGEESGPPAGAVGSPSGIEPEGFAIDVDAAEPAITVTASDASGAMYGVLDLAEQIVTADDVTAVAETRVNPEVGLRAIKFNLPWSAYRPGAQSEIHLDTCRDIEFWEAFLDMMAENRFNALTLWNVHPFPYMIRTEDFPEACPFSDEELAAWQSFWRELFGMASDRGIETYVVNWNIVVPPAFAETHGVDERNDTSEVVKAYTRESVRAVIDEYENLTGIGVSLCDWMKGLSPAEKQAWFDEAIAEGIRQANRPVKLINRSVLTGSIAEMRDRIDSIAAHENVSEITVPTKFNWSHGHSTTSLELTHDYSSGEVDERLWDPEPSNYDISWMVRNEDFFVLRWGDPGFIRDHVAANYEGADYVGGYFVGSEGYVPAKDFSHELHRHETWEYAFEKDWLFYEQWGRLLYDPETPDAVFASTIDERYGVDFGDELVEGLRQASQMPQKLASFHAGTWDYTLYAEGFLAPVTNEAAIDGRPRDDETPFITIDDLIYHEPLDPTYLSIPAFVEARAGAGDGTDTQADGTTTPLELADELETSGTAALETASELRPRLPQCPGALACELDDVATWGHLSLYFAEKLRAGVALQSYRQGGPDEDRETAVARLESAADRWDSVVDVTDAHYREIPYATDSAGVGTIEEGNTFSWANYREDVQRDVRVAERASRTDDGGE